MARYTLTALARQDLNEIWLHLADKKSEATADRVIERIYSECDALADLPGMGHYREELMSQEVRFWRVWSYLIVYRWNVVPIEVVAVVHGARDLIDFFDHDPR